MKRILTFIACMLVAGVAYAGWNIKQRSSGGTVVENQDGITTPLGSGGVIRISINDLTSANTSYGFVHRPGTIVKAYLVLTTSFSGSSAPVVGIFTMSTDGNAQAVQVTGSNATLTSAIGAGGIHGSQDYSTGNTISSGDVIAIVPSTVATAGGVNGHEAYVIIIIE